jgi:hypothetical protein
MSPRVRANRRSVMNRASVLLVAVMLCSCGTSMPNNIQGIDGPWFAQLNNADGTSAFNFSATLTQGNGSAISVSDLQFASVSTCFNSSTHQVGTFSVTGTTNGIAVGTFTLTITAPSSGAMNNELSLQGARTSDGSISGTWSLTGQPGCAGASGTFTMRLPHSDPP